MTESWEDAILKSFNAHGGQAELQHVYTIISRFFRLTDEQLRETQWGERPAFQHTIRSYVSNMTRSGELTRVNRGEYRLTEKGRMRLDAKHTH